MKLLNFIKKRWIIILISVILVAGGTFAAVTFFGGQNEDTIAEDDESEKEDEQQPKQRIRLDLTALSSDKNGIRTESGFKLTFPKGVKLDKKIIKEGLSVTPSFDYNIDSEADGMIIKPKRSLQDNKVYSFIINLPEQNIKESWAFQTRREFKVTSVFPADKGTGVPLNSGIEVTFSHENIKGFEGNFTIEPKVEGRFEIHKNVAVFVPKALSEDTVYTVKIAKGVTQGESNEALTEDFSFSFQTLTSNIQQDQEQYLYLYNWLYNFPSNIQPILEMSASKEFKDKELDISVYRYESVDSFLSDFEVLNKKPEWVIIDKKKHLPSISASAPIKNYTQKLLFDEKQDYYSYLTLPENLPEGQYLVVIKSGKEMDYAFIQVNDMQLYLNIGAEASLLWVNDMITGEAIQGVSFGGSNIKQVTTAIDGTAVINENIFKDSNNRSVCFKASREGHPDLVAEIRTGEYHWSYYDDARGNDKVNWQTIFLDRRTYLPTDTANVWGFVRPRKGDAPPKALTVNLVKSEYDYESNQSNNFVLETKEVSVTPSGTYRTSFSFKNLPNTYYTIEVKDGDKLISSDYLYIERYIKNDIVISIKPEYRAYYQGESFNAQIKSEFFEGTPVSGYELNYSIFNYRYGEETKGELVTDKNGNANIKYAIPDEAEPISWSPRYLSMYVRNKNPESTEIHQSEYIQVFPRDVMLETDVDFDNGTVMIHFETNNIDLTKVREEGNLFSSGYDDPVYKGDAIDTKLTATLYESYWDKRETGDRYDIISKQTYKTYEYFEVKRSLQSFEVQTKNGVAEYSLTIPDYSGRKYYSIIYEALDKKGRIIKEEEYISSFDDYWYGRTDSQLYYRLSFEDSEKKYKTNEPISFSLKCSNEEPITKGCTLYMVLQDGVKKYWTSQDMNQSISFDNEYIPNAYISAVYFDGRDLYTVYETGITYDYEDKELDVTLETDKQSYKPGDTVNAVLSVKDKSGAPVQASLNLSVVDESYFALYPQYINTIEDLYMSVYGTGIKNSYISYRSALRDDNGDECGEGEDGGVPNIRREFVDTAFFEALETGSDGKAQISFKLPDNLTSWRLTYQAVTEDIRAGSGKANITTKLPFFVKAVMNDAYIAGDSPVVLIKGYGEGIESGSEISYKVTINKGNDESRVIEAKGKAGDYTEIPILDLGEGLYKVVFEGSSGNYRDAVEKTFEVRKSLLSAKQVDYYTLEKDLKLDGIEGYAILNFYNANLNDYYRSLSKLYWSWGNRLDQIVSGNISRELLKKYFPGEYYVYGEKADISMYQKDDGGFAILPYASSDVELSAKIAALCIEDTNASNLKKYFKSIIEDSSTTPLQVSAAYWGLASMQEPVLLELQRFINEGEMTLDEKLYQANALAQLGDYKGAEKVYDEVVKAYSKDLEPYKYIDNKGDKDDIIRWTALAAMLAVKLDTADKNSYFGYVENNSPDEILVNLERSMLVKQGLPNISKNSGFTIEFDGKDEKVELSGITSKTYMLSENQLKSLKFSKIKGDVGLSVSYEKAQSPAETKNPIASIKRTYNKTGSNITLHRTDMVTVELSIEFTDASPEGYYEIVDLLPSGLRYINNYQAGDEGLWYYGQPDGQRVKFGCYHDGGKGTRNIIYKARISSPGTFTADHAMIKHWESDAYGYSERAGITIK